MSVASVSEEAEFQRLVGYVLGNQAAWIASIGVQTGMFRTIADAGANGIREGALAEQLGYTARYVEVWCRAAYAFELLEWDELSGYRMTPRMATLLLDSSDPQFMGGRIQLYTAFYEDYRAFPAGRVVIRHGDANDLDDRNAFDLVTMNVTLHETGGPAEHRNVLSRVRRALQMRGTVVISELPYPDSVQEYRENAVYKMYAGLQLHEALVGCGKIAQRELWNLLRAVGFANVRVAVHSAATRHVVLGEKPG